MSKTDKLISKLESGFAILKKYIIMTSLTDKDWGEIKALESEISQLKEQIKKEEIATTGYCVSEPDATPSVQPDLDCGIYEEELTCAEALKRRIFREENIEPVSYSFGFKDCLKIYRRCKVDDK
jgi:heptaprenylglyceryl phosphate synthase